MRRPFSSGRISIVNFAVTSYITFNISYNDELFPYNFLIDTGADISLRKYSKLTNVPKYFDDTTSVKGADKNVLEPTKTLCYSFLNFQIHDHVFNYIFHVVNDDFPLQFDGILGNDFLTNFKC